MNNIIIKGEIYIENVTIRAPLYQAQNFPVLE